MQYESGFKPAKCHRAAASGHKLGFVSLGFLQVRRTGKHAAAFLPYPGLCFPSLTLQLSRQGCSWSLFRQCWHGMGVWSSALCSAPHSPQPISQGSTGKAKSPFPWHQDAANACATGVGRVVPVAPVLLSWLQAHPSVWALHVQKHFTLQGRVSGVVGVAGREVQGAALFQL